MHVASAYHMLARTWYESDTIHSPQSNLLATTRGRFLTFFVLYASECIAYGLTSVAMVAFMRSSGVGPDQIEVFVAALFRPWGFKWAWAPVLDVIRLPRLGGRRAWPLFCTSMMVLTLTVTAVADFTANFRLLLMMIVANNVFCATQDVAIDSLAVSTLMENERGRGNGFMFGGQFPGIAIGGSGAICVYGALKFKMALLFVSGLLVLSLLFIFWFVRDPDVDKTDYGHSDTPMVREIVGRSRAFFAEVYIGFFRSGTGPRVAVAFGMLPPGATALVYATQNTLKVDYRLIEA